MQLSQFNCYFNQSHECSVDMKSTRPLVMLCNIFQEHDINMIGKYFLSENKVTIATES